MEEKAKRPRKRKVEHHRAESPDGAKPSKFWRKLAKPWRKLTKTLLPANTGSRKREDVHPRATPSKEGKRLPRMAFLIPVLGAGILLSVYLRSCNSTEVVIEESEETIKVRQLMNEIVQQQQQSEMGGAGVGAPPGAPAGP